MCWGCIIPRILVALSNEEGLSSNGKNCEVCHKESQRHLLLLEIRFSQASVTRLNITCYGESCKQNFYYGREEVFWEHLALLRGGRVKEDSKSLSRVNVLSLKVSLKNFKSININKVNEYLNISSYVEI